MKERLRAIKLWLKHWSKRKDFDTDWLFKYAWQWLRKPKAKLVRVNKIFNIYDISLLRKYIWPMAKFNATWFDEMFDPKKRGLMAWENGLFMHIIDRKKIEIKNKKILFLGVGNNKLSDYLESLGAQVDSDIKKRHHDISICLQKLNELDNWSEVIKAVKEIISSTRNKGWIYLSIDFYLCNDMPINKAYKWEKIKELLAEMKHGGLKIHFNVSRQENRLIVRSSKSNYRNRYMTTAVLMGKVRR